MAKRKQTKAQTLLEEATSGSSSSTATSGKVLESRLKQIERELRKLWTEHTEMLVRMNKLEDKDGSTG